MEGQDLLTNTSPRTVPERIPQRANKTKIQNMISHIRSNVQQRERNRQELVNDEEEFVELPTIEEELDDSFSVQGNATSLLNNFQDEDQICPRALEEMMVIVHTIRQQKEDLLQGFAYTIPILPSAGSDKERENNYDMFVDEN